MLIVDDNQRENFEEREIVARVGVAARENNDNRLSLLLRRPMISDHKSSLNSLSSSSIHTDNHNALSLSNSTSGFVSITSEGKSAKYSVQNESSRAEPRQNFDCPYS